MSEAKHTPGPWQRTTPNAICGALQDGGSNRHGVPITPLVCTVACRDEQDANARLIAAAPDLLAALEACEIAMETAAVLGLPQQLPPAYRDLWAAKHNAAKAAIAKAKG